MEEMKKVLEGKDKKIKGLKGQLRQAKEEAVHEYRDSDTLLSKLGSFFLEGFDDTLRQVREAYPDLDLSSVKIEDPAQASVIPITLENTEELFAGGAPLGDEKLAQAQNVQSVVDETHQPINVVEQKEDIPIQQQFVIENFFFFFKLYGEKIFIRRG